jgi:hypothetical protein
MVHRSKIEMIFEHRDGSSPKQKLCSDLIRHKETTRMSIPANIATLERQHQALEREISAEQQHPSCDDSKIAELERVKLIVKDQIARLQQDLSALASRVKLSAMEKRRAATQMSRRKSSSWYEGASRSISIIKAKPR